MNAYSVWFEPENHQRYHATTASAERKLRLGGQVMTLCGLRTELIRTVPAPESAPPETLESLYCVHCRKAIDP
jgi:hypothetical protein